MGCLILVISEEQSGSIMEFLTGFGRVSFILWSAENAIGTYTHSTTHQLLFWIIVDAGICDLYEDLAWIDIPGADLDFKNSVSFDEGLVFAEIFVPAALYCLFSLFPDIYEYRGKSCTGLSGICRCVSARITVAGSWC